MAFRNLDVIYSIIKAKIKKVIYNSNTQVATIGFAGNKSVATLITPYGMEVHSVPENLALVFSAFTDGSNRVGIPYNCEEKFGDLDIGEVAFGIKAFGNRVLFKKDGSVVVEGRNVNIVSSNVNIDSSNIIIANGSKGVARQDDTVTGTVTTPDGTFPLDNGKIASASSKVKCG